MCGDGENINNIVKVACRELNHAAEGSYILVYIYYWNYGKIIFSGYALLESATRFTTRIPIVPTVWTELICTGSEDTLSECDSTPVAEGYPVCDHDQDIFIGCTGELESCKNGQNNNIIALSVKNIPLYYVRMHIGSSVSFQ